MAPVASRVDTLVRGTHSAAEHERVRALANAAASAMPHSPVRAYKAVEWWVNSGA